MKVIVTGGTGFIGRAVLQKLIEDGHRVVLLTRHPDHVQWFNKNFVRPVAWNGKTQGDWSQEVDGADAVINLAGEPLVAKRWTKSVKEHIISSRVNATRAIVEAIRKAEHKPSVLINANAVGFYGNVPDGEVTESSPKGSGFLSDTCEIWEKEARAAEALGVRLVICRIGIVLEKDGGALTKMVPPFQMFIGGPIGSGRQWFPWVHRDDVAGAMIFALDNSRVKGVINVTAPDSVTMGQFCVALGKALKRPCWAPVPAVALKLLLGEMSGMLLEGQKAIPKKLEQAGYLFIYPKLDEALEVILRK